MLPVTFVSGNGSENLGRVGKQMFFNYFFSGKNIILCILKGSKFRLGRVTLNTGIR